MASDGEDGEPTIYISQRVNADYVNEPERLAQVLGKSLERPIVVKPRDTLSGIISREYQVGESNAPEAYPLFARRISERNQLVDPNKLVGGMTLYIPDLPPLALQRPSTTNPYNKIAKLSTYSYLVKQAIVAAKKKIVRIYDKLRLGAREVVQLRRVSRKDAQALLSKQEENQTASYQQQGEAAAVNSPIEIQLAQAPTADLYEPLSAEDAVLVRQKLAGQPKKHPTLIVLDDAWPDDAAFIESSKFLVKAIKEIRQKYKMGEPMFSRGLLKANTARFVQNLPRSPSHASMIKRSIEQLRALEPGQERVKVVYIPLSRAQVGADEILRELIEIRAIVRDMGSDQKVEVPPDIRKNARNLAKDIVQKISDSLSDSHKILKTDQAVVEAVIVFVMLHAEMTKEPDFLNMSWTTPKLQFQIFIPASYYGLTVVAAGNEGDKAGTTVYDLEREFAFRSWLPGDVVAVMNINPDGSPACDSCLLRLDRNMLGFAFPGSLSESECGTSFSSPRVAWLIAAREAMIKTTIRDDKQIGEWRDDLITELHGLRDNEQASFNSLRLNVGKLFAPIPNP